MDDSSIIQHIYNQRFEQRWIRRMATVSESKRQRVATSKFRLLKVALVPLIRNLIRDDSGGRTMRARKIC